MRAATITLALLVGAVPALADGKADVLFEKGKKALAAKQYSEACAAFEQSDQLDPGIGVKLNAARCYEAWGKLASAYLWYADALKLAEAQKDKRQGQIKALVEALDADVPTLTLQVPPNSDLAGSQLKLDGRPIADATLGEETRVDPGPHELTWQSKGARRSKTIALERGASREVQIELDPALPAATGPSLGPAPEVTSGGVVQPTATSGKSRKIVSLVLVGAGAVALGVSGYLTLSARTDYNDALDAHCQGVANACTPVGLEQTGDARSRANLATGFAIGGIAAAAAGVILYLTTPTSTEERGVAIAPAVSPTSAGVTLRTAW